MSGDDRREEALQSAQGEAGNEVTARPALAEVVLRPIRAHHAFEACVEQLATAIRLGAYPEGTVLPPERELAGIMAVSRPTLREAIAALRTAGLVATTRGRGGGTVVRYRSGSAATQTAPPVLAKPRARYLDSLAFRRVVEPGACYLAANRRLSSTEQKMLRKALDDVELAADSHAHRQADARLHLAIARVTESPLTYEAVTQVQSDLDAMLRAIPVLRVNIDHSNSQHRSIIDAVLSAEPSRARRAMEQHCDDTAALLRGLLGYVQEGPE
jgi:GntR family transcriptional repressor for pyruvate dehydrogenase complex